MRKRKSVIVDEIMRDYYRELRWKERIAKMKEQQEEIKNEKHDINETR